jgi:colanic acid/amylovoran biosynthesis glycosyltransferase
VSHPRRVGYVVSRFPKLSETFILREMDALEATGWHLSLYPLITESGGPVHPAAVPWLSRARELPLLSRTAAGATARLLVRRPRQLIGLCAAVVRGYASSPSALVRALALLPSSIRLAELVRDDGVPQLHAHYATYPLLACWVVHALDGVPYSVTIHAHDIFTGTPMLARKLRSAAAVVVISQFNRDFLVRQVDPDLADRTTVVRCGVDVSHYAGPGAAERQPPAPGDAFTIVCVGSLQEYKGQRHLIEACRLMVDRGHQVRCLLVGGGVLADELARQVEAAGLVGVVELVGAKTEQEVAALLGAADVYAQPSVIASTGQMEGIPVALMEALASRLPVVATALSGVPELVRDGDTGWLVPPGDARALADALEQVLADPAAARVRAEAGRALVEQEYDLHDNVRRLSALLDAVAPQGPPGP